MFSAFSAVASFAFAAPAENPALTNVDHSKLVSVSTLDKWMALRDTYGPTYTAGPGWLKLVAFAKKQLAADGIVNITEYKFPYTRWYTSEYPDKSGWSFTSDGVKVNVASYGTQTGTTGPKGVAAPMILYDLSRPVSQRPPLAALKGKIVVIKQQLYNTLGTDQRVPLGVPAPKDPPSYCGNPPGCKAYPRHFEEASPTWGRVRMSADAPFAGNNGYKDYEYESNPEEFPGGIGATAPLTVEASYRNRDQFSQVIPVIWNVLMPSGAVGAVTVMDLSPLAAAGARIHPTPQQSNVPLLMLDRVAGAKVIADAEAGKRATLVLNAHEEQNAPAEEFTAVLPGRDYGTAKDKAVMMATHMDGPSIIEDDGAYAMLSVLHYFSQIPQSQRPKTLIAYFDTRHFVPGTENAYPFDMVIDKPELFRNVVGGVAMEHWGERQFAEAGDDYHATGNAATTYIWGWPNPLAIDAVTRAIKDQGLPRAINDVPARPGIHGQPQQPWMGAGFSEHLVELGGWPGWHISGDWPSAGFQAYYPEAKSRFDAGLFVRQSAVAVQLVSSLMTGDVIAMAPAWGYIQVDIATAADADFRNPANAVAGRAELLRKFDLVFAAVKAGDYPQAKQLLQPLREAADRQMTDATAKKIDEQIEKCRAMSETAQSWKAQAVL
ncbi:MAG: hypothetical protein V4527_05605 [Pseudomonadota bacterium]